MILSEANQLRKKLRRVYNKLKINISLEILLKDIVTYEPLYFLGIWCS